jgi:hypothetical protein
MIVIVAKFGAMWTNNRGDNSSQDSEFTFNFANVVQNRSGNLVTRESGMQISETTRHLN